MTGPPPSKEPPSSKEDNGAGDDPCGGCDDEISRLDPSLPLSPSPPPSPLTEHQVDNVSSPWLVLRPAFIRVLLPRMDIDWDLPRNPHAAAQTAVCQLNMPRLWLSTRDGGAQQGTGGRW